MSENRTVPEPAAQTQTQRPTLTLPPRSNMEALFTGSGFGLSPGPMTLVSNFFSDHDSEFETRSFSQLLAGAINSPRPVQDVAEPGHLRFRQTRPDGQFGPGDVFMVPPGLSPGPLLESPGLFPGQGPFGMSHQQALAQVTAQAQANMHVQGDFQSSLGLGLSTSTPFSDFSSSDSSMHQNITSSALESRDMKDSSQFPVPDQRSQPSSAIIDKPTDDGYNWRKYGQKQVKGSEFPRSYYKCTHPSCPVRKKVERSLVGQVTEIIYKGQHNHNPPQKRSKDGVNPNLNLGTQNPKFGVQSQAVIMNSASESMAYFNRSDQESSLVTEDHLSSDGEEVANDRDNGTREDEPEPKRRNMEVRVLAQAVSHRTVAEPKIVVQTNSEVDLLDDGYRWRKYGQKVVKGNPNPRSYYKCTYAGCNVRKHVERAATDPKAVVTTYEGKHDHDLPVPRTSSHNTANGSVPQLRPHTSVGGGNTNAYIERSDSTQTNQQPVALLRFKDERTT